MAAGTYNDGGEAAAAASAEEADAGGRRPRRAAAANHRFFSDGALRAQSTVRDLTGRSALSTEDDDGRYPAVRRGRFALAMAAAAARQGGQQQGGQQQRVLGLVSKRPRGDRTPVHLRGRARARGLASPGSGGGGGGGGGGYAYADSNSEDDSDGLDDAFRSRGAGRAYSGNTGEVSFLGSFYGPASAAPAEPRSP
ncbi:hypothetical protein FOA52_009989 [Chlamydomonas sp. UWO 241]|nr:hypothetical protein FOA52_009989 [Chlamydomonas sp. UWO 241]